MKSITAYIRLYNEENTILPCLESIKNIFDKVLIIYSEITDRSLDLVYDYINQNNINNFLIKQYPYSVLPPHSKEYKNNSYDYNHSLASYYNFGLQFIETDLLMKIDADQIYLTESLRDLVKNSCKTLDKNNAIACMGNNCIIHNNKLMIHNKQPFNGGHDHFIIYTDNADFIQNNQWELLIPKQKTEFYCDKKMYWFHMKDGHWYNDQFISSNQYDIASLRDLDSNLINLYKTHILPILIKTNSKYQNLQYK